MCLNYKRFCGSATFFFLFPSIFLNAATATPLSNVGGASASPSQRDIQEAQKIVGQYLQNKTATDWLSGGAKTNSTPLTPMQLMNAILQKTKRGDKVWQAASTLLNASNSTNSISSRMDFNSGQSDNWKDLIANIEMEDDIICLYRKNSNETTKRADDWKKFLETVTPGREVHLAFDTGRKYVICLKNKAPETTSQATSTTTKKEMTTMKVSSAIPTATTNAGPTMDQPSSKPGSASRALKMLPAEAFPQTPDGRDNPCRGREDEKNEIYRQMGRWDSSASSPRRIDRCGKNPSLQMCDQVRDGFPYSSFPVLFVVLNPNDYSSYQGLSKMNLPVYQDPRSRQRWPCQNRRCMTKPLSVVQFDAPPPTDPASSASKRLRDPFFDSNSVPLQSIGGLGTARAKNQLFPPNILKQRARNDAIARRTFLHAYPTSPALGARATSCLREAKRLYNQRTVRGKSKPDTSYIDYQRCLSEINRVENSRNNDRGSGRAFGPIHKIHTPPITRPYQQPIADRLRSWDHSKLPYSRKVSSPIQNFQPKPQRPAPMQYFHRKDPNFLASRPPCRGPHCVRNYQNPFMNYARPRPFGADRFQFGNPGMRLPALYSESLVLSENPGLNNFPNKCPKPCDRPIKLQVLISSKVREPLDISVLPEPGQKVDLVGFPQAMLPPRQPGASINFPPFPTRLPADTHTYAETEVNTRMDLEKLNTNQFSLTESEFSMDNVFENAETNSTTQVAGETTTFASDIVSVAVTEIDQPVTKPTTLNPSTVIATDEPMTTTTPSPTSTTV